MCAYNNRGEAAAERLLESVRSETGVVPTPVDPIVIARSLGINVFEQQMEADVSGYMNRPEFDAHRFIGAQPLIGLCS